MASELQGVCVAGVVVIFADSLRARAYVVDQLFVFLLPKLIPLGLFFQMLSVYITVLAAFDCFISVMRGPEAHHSRSTWAPRVLAMVVITVAGYNVVQFADLEAIECMHPDNYTLYELCPTELRISETYVVVYKGYMYALSMAFIPFVLLSILTIGILYMLRKRQQNTGKVMCEKEDQGSPVVLLLVIALFLACNVTSLLVNIFEMLKVDLGDAASAILIDVGNFLVVVNATANFFVYWGSSREYKTAVRRLVRKYTTKRKAVTLVNASQNTNADFV
ncbi:Serpentine type 7TM GPCR chemoreceptor Srsx [Parelaphostrongylus tenuis]|uniref:Serpentine type 7TM GPCR chemoreceptor Srsx n=1 Tax=Parelaphostrongylus tenuis TaxID=148309 RepID=A0AAD5R9V3_PARTN|nr:Serpentine type 7TM GPCR chemoreceptor Srsx [Parelaphostrongylus tenuis]